MKLKGFLAGALLFILSSEFSYAADTLVVGVEASRAPFVYVDKETQKIEGFEVDMLTEIAKDAGMDIEFKNMPFDALLPSVLTETIDVAVSCISMTEERAQIIDFVGPYYHGGLNAMIHREFSHSIKKAEDLKGHKVCVVAGTTCEGFAKNINGAEVLSFGTEEESFEAINNNDCDFIIADYPVIKYGYLRQAPNKYYTLGSNLSVEDFGIIVSKMRPELLDRVKYGFQTMMKSKSFNKIYKKWFNEDPVFTVGRN